VAVLQAGHAAEGVPAEQVVRAKHLLDGFSALGQEAALVVVPAPAVLAEQSHDRVAVAVDVSPAVAVVAHCPLRAAVGGVLGRQAVEATLLVEAGVLVVAQFLAAEAAHVGLEVPVKLLLGFVELIDWVAVYEDGGWAVVVGFDDSVDEGGGLGLPVGVRAGHAVGVHHAGCWLILSHAIAVAAVAGFVVGFVPRFVASSRLVASFLHGVCQDWMGSDVMINYLGLLGVS